MIFQIINWRVNTKKSFDKDYMVSFFKKKKQIFLKKNKELTGLDIEIVRNFRGKFRNMSLKYTLCFGKDKKVIRAKISKYQDTPLREWNVLNWLKKNNLKNIIYPLYYYKPLNIFFYQEFSGTSFETLLLEHKVKKLVEYTPKIAKWLRLLHKAPLKKNLLPVKDAKEELKERRHWYFLVRKCAPYFYGDYSALLKNLLNLRKKFISPKHIVHSDFHWGNVICGNPTSSKGKVLSFKIIDFGYSFSGDPLEDVGGFLAQTDSMFRYYAPDFLDTGEKIRKIFLNNYFPKKINDSEKKRLIYFEISKMLQMISVLALTGANEKIKKDGINTLLKEIKKKFKTLN